MLRQPANRIQASLLHLSLSALVVSSVFLVVYFVWYPPPLFQVAGGRHLFLVLALVDIAIGPLITLIIYRPGKPGLGFDIAAIVMLQVAALAYGGHTVYQARPVWIVYANDRFDMIRANQVVAGSIDKAPERFRALSSTGPQLAAARQPATAAARLAISMDAAGGGPDVTSYPELYRDYAEVRPEVLSRAKPIAELRNLNPGENARIADLVASLSRAEDDLRYVPVRAGKDGLVMIIDAKSGNALQMSTLRPWS